MNYDDVGRAWNTRSCCVFIRMTLVWSDYVSRSFSTIFIVSISVAQTSSEYIYNKKREFMCATVSFENGWLSSACANANDQISFTLTAGTTEKLNKWYCAAATRLVYYVLYGTVASSLFNDSNMYNAPVIINWKYAKYANSRNRVKLWA